MDYRQLLLSNLTVPQQNAVSSSARRLVVVAGAGSGKTEVMARRVAWWVAVGNVPRESIVAFTFTEAAAEELKFRIRRQLQRIAADPNEVALGGMYIGTIHGFCLKMLRELDPDEFHNYDVLDESSRLALVQRAFNGVLGLSAFRQATGQGFFASIETFLFGYDLLHEYDEFNVDLSTDPMPSELGAGESNWAKSAVLRTPVGPTPEAAAFADSAARYYAYMRCRRFLDFSTSQSELLRLLRSNAGVLAKVRQGLTHYVVDEVQDINPVQDRLIRMLVGDVATLTAVGDHRQAIYNWRGGRVALMGALYDEVAASADGEVIELPDNFRSTERIIGLANRWSSTIGTVAGMGSPAMVPGRKTRVDFDPLHCSTATFGSRLDEADWIAATIDSLVDNPARNGAAHDTQTGERGISYADIAILLRSGTSAREYMQALERRGIPAVFRAGPDLFSQPEVLLFIAALARSAGIAQFVGGPTDKSLPNRIAQVLASTPDPTSVITAACRALRTEGVPLEPSVEDRLLVATELIDGRVTGGPVDAARVALLRTPKLKSWLLQKAPLRRVFPQALFNNLLAEVGVGPWQDVGARGTSALFHLGQLSTLIKGIETPGWTSSREYRYQVIGLCWWGAENGRSEEAPLLVAPDAVTISTIHAAKGLEYGAVFVADVCSRRFPSSFAGRVPRVPFSGPLLQRIDPAELADNANRDSERRLMYVALTRAERYLFVTSSVPGGSRTSFFRSVDGEMANVGGTQLNSPPQPAPFRRIPIVFKRDVRLVTSFSDLRYYLACPYDFFLRKVLGFAPTIDQAFGYGRGVHNLMRAVHTDAARWADLAKTPEELKKEIERLVAAGVFYLRYTTGDPADNMRRRAVEVVSDYVRTYAPELSRLQFEAEREFETLIEEEQVLVSGAIDAIRLDDPPRVTLIDFKSGERESDAASKLDEEEMRLQISLYGLAAKKELEYEPDQGVVRYLGETDPKQRELSISLADAALKAARGTVVDAARRIRDRQFQSGPAKPAASGKERCVDCDFGEFCGRPEAIATRTSGA
jgi:DNA helicase-2/ATP-dependent DNA helicase PcrA